MKIFPFFFVEKPLLGVEKPAKLSSRQKADMPLQFTGKQSSLSLAVLS
jgi:hypothetical protein